MTALVNPGVTFVKCDLIPLATDSGMFLGLLLAAPLGLAGPRLLTQGCDGLLHSDLRLGWFRDVLSGRTRDEVSSSGGVAAWKRDRLLVVYCPTRNKSRRHRGLVVAGFSPRQSRHARAF